MSRCTCDPKPAGKGGDDDRDAGEVLDASEPLDASELTDAAPMRDAEPEPPPPPETCDNDRDDDGDGKVDCADDACGSRSCEREAAAGFRGPIELRRSETGTPDCDGAFDSKSFEAGETPTADAVSCGSCSCTPDHATCAAFVDFSTGTDAGCGGTTCTTSVNQSCTEIMPPCIASQTSAFLGTKLPSASGGCTPSVQAPVKPDVSWAKRVVGCSAGAQVRGGCALSEQCLPKRIAGAGFDVALCIWREGDHDCPSDKYTNKRVYYRDADDTRSCSACACSGANCSYRWSVFTDADTSCATPIVELTSPDQCLQVNPAMDKLRVGASITGDGACTPSGGASQGAVSGADALTVCCVP
jgi:hypothetical protein